MLGIMLYSIGVMYTPGPVNILSLHCGMQKKFSVHIPFSLGVATSVCCMFLLAGYAGSNIAHSAFLPFISAAGSLFIGYLAYKIMFSHIDITGEKDDVPLLRYKDGVLMQLFNPKAIVAVLPVTTILFPAAGIDGIDIAVWSVLLGVTSFGAPFVYAVMGSTISKHIKRLSYFVYLNRIMAVLLLAVAVDIAYEHVYLALQ
ncbi:LysE family translocator [Desulfovibrio inopinatus]|uniref:LysE family translocator n=1 Tax=Desulfovibrio inopinatus TaxID=102109 RepID=UPI0003FB4F15|nr:LysE family transporter [Desulfovibrio inopinatus]